MTPSDKAIQLRDELNKIADRLMADNDQEGHVLACCVALAVEEVEKWMYRGEFTPSVAPFREGRKFKMPVPAVSPSPSPSPSPAPKPAWFPDEPIDVSKLKAWQRIKERAKQKPVVVADPSPLDTYDPSHWNGATMAAFKDGNRPVFLRMIQTDPRLQHVSLKQVSDYLRRMKTEYPHLWGICESSRNG